MKKFQKKKLLKTVIIYVKIKKDVDIYNNY